MQVIIYAGYLIIVSVVVEGPCERLVIHTKGGGGTNDL